MAKRKNKQGNVIKFERIQPTHQRIALGDLEIGEDQVFRSTMPTILEKWTHSGYLGGGKIATERFEALQFLMELSESAQLMASNTSQFDRVGDRTTGGSSSDTNALDICRDLYRNIPRRYWGILQTLCCSPTANVMVCWIELQAASDYLIEAVERYKKNRTNHESILDESLKI